MTPEEKIDLIKGYEKDYFSKTRERLHIKVPGVVEYDEIQKYVNNFICKYNIILGRRVKISSKETDKIHLLRWKLKKKFYLMDKEIAYFSKCDKSNVQNSINRVDGYIKTGDERFLSRYSLEVSE